MKLFNLKQSLQAAVRRSLGIPEAWFNKVMPLDGGRMGKGIPNPYANSVWVMRAIKKVAHPIAAVPLEFYDGDNEVEDPALEAFWKHPAIGLSWFDFVEASTIWLKLRGECFWIMGDNALRPFPDVSSYEPLIVARPDRMKPIKSGVLEGWEYTDGNRQRHVLLREQVVHLKFYNPYDEARGLAEYQAASVATEADYAAGEYSRNLMENNGDTGPIIAAKGGMLQAEQQEQIIQQLRMKRQLAQQGEFRAAFLTADVTVENPTALTTDANFSAMRLGNRHEIFIAFGVPPSMADKMESYSIGSASDWYILIFETCIPTSQKLAGGIEQVLKRQTGRELTACFEFDEHPVMQRVRAERLDSAEKLWAKGMPLSEINEYLNLGLNEFPGWDVGYLPFSVSPLTSDGLPSEPEPQADPAFDENNPITEAIRALQSRRLPLPAEEGRGEGESPDCDCCSIDFSNLAIRATDSNATRRWKSLMAKRRETIRAYESKFGAVLMTARREVLSKLESIAALRTSPSTISKAAAADFMFNLDNFSRLFQTAMRNVAANALQTAGDQLFAEVKRDDPWSMPAPETIAFLKHRENKLANVPDDVFARIKDQIEEGLNGGESISKIAHRVRAEFNDIATGRAKVIASTETAAAYGTGRHLAMKSAGIQWKEWLASGLDNTRAAHRLMNGTIVAINEPFIVVNPKTGETDSVLHPAASDGAPWNVINCHCVDVAVAEGPQGEVEPST